MALSKGSRYLYTKDFPGSLLAESYRSLRANILLSNIDASINSFVVTSADSGEGKSTICANLAIVMAQAEKRVLLIDCDLRLPTQHELFQVSLDHGLTRLLSSYSEGEEPAVIGDEVMHGLTVVGSGPPPPNPSEFLSSRRFRYFIKRVSSDFDTVIIDTPPVGVVSDAAILSTMVDGTVMVLDLQKGHRNMSVRAKKLLENVNANILGMVLNNYKLDKDTSSYHY
ncbi:MAG: CpsD/CapB family tyrosine-protein kinase [Thermoleophilia bacterium]